VTYWIMRALFILFFRVFGSWEVRGHENVPKEGAALIAPNHLSALDPCLIGCALKRPGWFMAKAELFEVWGLRWLIRGMHAYPVKRGSADRAALKRTLDHLKNGEIVCVFPEGTRSPDGRLGPVEAGIGMLALKSGAPVVPVGIRGTDRLLPREGKSIRRAKIRVLFGPPLHFPPAVGTRLDREACQETADQVRAALLALLEDMDSPAHASAQGPNTPVASSPSARVGSGSSDRGARDGE
jgi:1-acyl-sn-glycerol-3-phosphate acyltransferase